jgi:hypothetical protein
MPPTAPLAKPWQNGQMPAASSVFAGIPAIRDFKPQNAMVGEDGRVRVLDFGLARADSDPDLFADLERTRDSLPDAQALVTSLTVTGSLIGTPAFMAPEQFRGERADARSDQFALCVALYEALYGARPFPGDTLTALMHSVLAGEVREPGTSAAAARLPRGLRAAILRGLARRPEDRHPTMDALLAAIDRAAQPRRRPWLAGLALTLGLGAGAGGLALRTGDLGHVCEDRGNAEIAAVWSPARADTIAGALRAVDRPGPPRRPRRPHPPRAPDARRARAQPRPTARRHGPRQGRLPVPSDSLLRQPRRRRRPPGRRRRDRPGPPHQPGPRRLPGRPPLVQTRQGPPRQRRHPGPARRPGQRRGRAQRPHRPPRRGPGHQRRALALYAEAGLAGTAAAAVVQRSLADALAATGDLDEAKAQLTDATAVLEREYCERHPDRAAALRVAGHIAALRGDLPTAIARYDLALHNLAGVVPEDSGFHQELTADAASARLEHGEQGRAEAMLRRSLAAAQRRDSGEVPTLHPAVFELRLQLTRLLLARGQLAEAETLTRELSGEAERAWGSDEPHVALALAAHAEVLLAADRPAEALPRAERAHALATARSEKVQPRLRYVSDFVLARALAATGDPARATSLAAEARALAQRSSDTQLAADISAWLAGHGGA